MRRPTSAVLAGILLLAVGWPAAAANPAEACQRSFVAEGDPRNGAEYMASVELAQLGVRQALAQLRALAQTDGFRVLGESGDVQQGKLAIEQHKGVKRPFLIELSARQQGKLTQVVIATRLHPGATAREQDMRAGMCGMLGRLRTGAEGEALAESARLATAQAELIQLDAWQLARDVFEEAKLHPAELVSARYQGRRYLLDGQIQEPFVEGDSVRLFYRVLLQHNGLLETRDQRNSKLWPSVVCRMAPDQVTRAKRLRTQDFAKLSGTVTAYIPEVGNARLELEGCRFAH